jgi:16S rRNA processing protein RimM
MIVIDQNLDEILGVVDGLNNYGADDCIIVKPSINSVDKQERLIPFIKDKFIKSVDKKKRVIKVDWQKDF